MGPLAAVPLLVWNLAVDDGGFTSSGTPAQWEWGVPTVGPGGPDSAWCTQRDGVYLNDAISDLEWGLPDLAVASTPRLELVHWFDIQPGDHGVLQARIAGVWTTLEPIYGHVDPAGFTGASPGWERVQYDLAGLDSGSTARLRFTANETGASAGWFVAEVGVYDGDITPPQIVVLAEPEDTDLPNAVGLVQAIVRDDVPGVTAEVAFRVNGGTISRLGMVDMGGGLHEASIPGQALGSTVEWWLEATDGAYVSRYPELADASYEVGLVSPTGLAWTTPDIRVAQFLQLDWGELEGNHPATGYRVVDALDGALLVETPAPPVFVPLAELRPLSVAVVGVTDVGDTPPSESLDVTAEIPSLDFVVPDVLYQGETRRVLMQGSSLYLDQAASVLDVGEGVEVMDLQVLDAATAELELRVDATAALGPRTVSVDGTAGRFVFPEALEVRPITDGPVVVSVTPDRLIQGETTAMVVELSQPPASTTLEVSPGPSLISTTPPVVDGVEVALNIAVDGNAAPGEYTLVLDDGARFWTVPVDVAERTFELETACGGCTTGPHGGAWGPLLLGMWLAGVRRRDEVSTD